MQKKDNDYSKHYCGDCCWFKHEDTYGWGMCYENNDYEPVYCGAMSCDKYISVAEMRHHLAILMLHNRWRRSNEPTGFYKMQNPKEIGLAIDFCIDYCKTFMKI